MSRTLLVLACVVTSLAIALPASAAKTNPTGERISLFSPPTAFPADTPFYVDHGWACELGAPASDPGCMSQEFAQGTFSLYLDGVLQPYATHVFVADGVLNKFRLTNYPSGLPAGPHTFVGVWTKGKPGVVALTITVTVDFTP